VALSQQSALAAAPDGRACDSAGRPKTPGRPETGGHRRSDRRQPRCGPLGRRRRRGELLRRGRSTVASMSRRLSSGRCRYGDALL